jgi:2-oxo-3-hexenedioate decarboxylase
MPDIMALAEELLSAYMNGNILSAPPSAREGGLNLNDAFAVENEFLRLRMAAGRRSVGLKVGYANKAIWRVLKLDTLVWAHMYDDTVHMAAGGAAELALPHLGSRKIEPEIVFRLKRSLPDAGLDAAAALDAVEWLAIGFEIIECPFPEWQFQPVDFVAAFGLHRALVVGEPRPVEPALVPKLVEELPRLKVRLLKNGVLIEEGSGKNSLRSPALCLAELAGALLRQPGAQPLAAGDLVSSGTLTGGSPAVPGEVWSVEVDGIPLSGLAVSLR